MYSIFVVCATLLQPLFSSGRCHGQLVRRRSLYFAGCRQVLCML